MAVGFAVITPFPVAPAKEMTIERCSGDARFVSGSLWLVWLAQAAVWLASSISILLHPPYVARADVASKRPQ